MTNSKNNYNPNNKDPIKINIENLKEGLSKKQTERIAYESMLLRKTPQDLILIAPFLYQNDITAANTKVQSTEVKNEEPKKELPKVSDTDEEIYEYYKSIYGSYDVDGF